MCQKKLVGFYWKEIIRLQGHTLTLVKEITQKFFCAVTMVMVILVKIENGMSKSATII